MAIEPEEPMTLGRDACTPRAPQFSRRDLRYYTETYLLAWSSPMERALILTLYHGLELDVPLRCFSSCESSTTWTCYERNAVDMNGAERSLCLGLCRKARKFTYSLS